MAIGRELLFSAGTTKTRSGLRTSEAHRWRLGVIVGDFAGGLQTDSVDTCRLIHLSDVPNYETQSTPGMALHVT